MAVKGKGMTCSCNVGLMLVAKAIKSIGLFVLVAGLGSQLAVGLTGAGSLSTYMTVLPLYFVGMVVLGVGKILGSQACCNCGIHGKM